MRRPPFAFWLWLAVIAGVALFVALVSTGLVPLEALALLLFSNVVMLVTVMLLAALGGAFVGMLVAQRIFSSREFTPLERSLLEAASALRELREGQLQIEERLARLEKEIRR